MTGIAETISGLMRSTLKPWLKVSLSKFSSWNLERRAVYPAALNPGPALVSRFPSGVSRPERRGKR